VLTYPEIRGLFQLHVVAVVVATEVPPDSPDPEFRAVIDVMRNRSKQRALSLVEVVLQKNQFSAVCREEYWRRAMSGKWMPAHVERCFNWIQRDWADTTDGADHYYSPITMQPAGAVPSWAAALQEVNVPGVRQAYFRFFKGKP
jgi:hypothetical protein